MSDNNALDEDCLDALLEIINISYGLMNARLSDQISSFSRLEVPRVLIFNRENARGYVLHGLVSAEQNYLLCRRKLSGNLDGELLLMIAQNDADRLCHLWHETPDKAVDHKKSALELANLLFDQAIVSINEQLGFQLTG